MFFTGRQLNTVVLAEPIQALPGTAVPSGAAAVALQWSEHPALGMAKPREEPGAVCVLSRSCHLLCNRFLNELLFTF